MAILQAPAGVYVNYNGNIAHVVWDRVKKDVELNPATVTAYYIYKTSNPNASGFGSPIAIVNTTDPYGEIDTFYTDYNIQGEYIYRICPFDGVDLGNCSLGFGVSNDSTETFTPEFARWDEGLWDLGYWGL